MTINNEFYHDLGERWYTANDDPVALLRAESKLRNPWIKDYLENYFNGKKCKVLDIACGAGFLSNYLAEAGHSVTAIDLSKSSLEIARLYDSTGNVNYREMNAAQLDFEDQTFDAVFAMDFLEHIPNPEVIFNQASRVLKPNGLFFFHTFNRNRLSQLIVIKGVEWFVKNTPKNMHVYDLLVRPSEARNYCKLNNLEVLEIKGIRPAVFNRSFLKMIRTGLVDHQFHFKFSKSTLTSYLGIAKRQG